MNLFLESVVKNVGLKNIIKPDVVSMFKILSILAIPYIMAFGFLGLMNLILNKNQSIAKRLSLIIFGGIYVVAMFSYAFNLAFLTNPTKYGVDSTKTIIILAVSLTITILLKVFCIDYKEIDKCIINNNEKPNEDDKETKSELDVKEVKKATMWDKIIKYLPIFFIVACLLTFKSNPKYITIPILVTATTYYILVKILGEEKQEKIFNATTFPYFIWMIAIMATHFFQTHV